MGFNSGLKGLRGKFTECSAINNISSIYQTNLRNSGLNNVLNLTAELISKSRKFKRNYYKTKKLKP
jgi:hypothetical protein